MHIVVGIHGSIVEGYGAAPLEVGRNILKIYLYLSIENYFQNIPRAKVSMALFLTLSKVRLIITIICKSNPEFFERNSKFFG